MDMLHLISREIEFPSTTSGTWISKRQLTMKSTEPTEKHHTHCSQNAITLLEGCSKTVITDYEVNLQYDESLWACPESVYKVKIIRCPPYCSMSKEHLLGLSMSASCFPMNYAICMTWGHSWNSFNNGNWGHCWIHHCNNGNMSLLSTVTTENEATALNNDLRSHHQYCLCYWDKVLKTALHWAVLYYSLQITLQDWR
jgi:hypothetical protein